MAKKLHIYNVGEVVRCRIKARRIKYVPGDIVRRKQWAIPYDVNTTDPGVVPPIDFEDNMEIRIEWDADTNKVWQIILPTERVLNFKVDGRIIRVYLDMSGSSFANLNPYSSESKDLSTTFTANGKAYTLSVHSADDTGCTVKVSYKA